MKAALAGEKDMLEITVGACAEIMLLGIFLKWISPGVILIFIWGEMWTSKLQLNVWSKPQVKPVLCRMEIWSSERKNETVHQSHSAEFSIAAEHSPGESAVFTGQDEWPNNLLQSLIFAKNILYGLLWGNRERTSLGSQHDIQNMMWMLQWNDSLGPLVSGLCQRPAMASWARRASTYPSSCTVILLACHAKRNCFSSATSKLYYWRRKD